MRVCHLSDTHGRNPALRGDFDVVVHSGDFCPNLSFGVRVLEEPSQKMWIEREASRLDPSWWRAPVLITPGNHDFIDIVPALRAVGIDARRCVDEVVVAEGVRFWGHPWTPSFNDWAWMCGTVEMAGRLTYLAEAEVDVLVCHGPMHGVLDRNADGDRVGCKELRKVLQGAERKPRALLCGHIHESAGRMSWSGGMIVSNAALTQRIVTI